MMVIVTLTMTEDVTMALKQSVLQDEEEVVAVTTKTLMMKTSSFLPLLSFYLDNATRKDSTI